MGPGILVSLLFSAKLCVPNNCLNKRPESFRVGVPLIFLFNVGRGAGRYCVEMLSLLDFALLKSLDSQHIRVQSPRTFSYSCFSL